MKKQYRGDELKAIRRKMGITLAQAAEILGVGYNTYISWEYNNVQVTDLAWQGITNTLEKSES